MLETIFSSKTTAQLEKERKMLESDLILIKKFYEHIEKNKGIIASIIKLGIKDKDIRDLFKSIRNIIKLEKKQEFLELKSIQFLESSLKNIVDNEIKLEINSMLVLLRNQKQTIDKIIELDDKLTSKKYNQQIIAKLSSKIKQTINEQLKLLKTHAIVINKLLGKISEEESKIKKMLENVYGRAVSKRRANFMKKYLMLSDRAEAVNCFILNSFIEKLIANSKNKKTRDILINLFRGMGTKAVQEIILFKIDKSQDQSILVKAFPEQPQRMQGIIEQKLPNNIRIKIINIVRL